MKKLELKLKKYVLIVENEFENKIDFIDNELGIFYFLCKGSELTEEMASELVDYWQNMANDGFIFENYKDNIPKKLTAIKSFISAVESKKFHWLENPIPTPEIQGGYAEDGSFIGGYDDNWIKEWQEAEEKTFKNPLIFVKK